MKTRFSKEDRKNKILDAAMPLAEAVGYSGMTRDQLAAAAGCSNALISIHFGSMAKLQDAVVVRAISDKNLRIIGQAIIARHARALVLPAEIKKAAQDFLFS